MTYTIGEFAKKCGLTPHTLRFYEKEGLLPFVHRSASGIRFFSEPDIEWLVIINCLKNTGMSIKEIKVFIDWCMQGDTTIEKRYHFFIEHRKKVEKQMKELRKYLKKIDYKIWYYQTALEADTLSIHQTQKCIKEEKRQLLKDAHGN